MGTIDRAIAAIPAGELVVYPTETVYGLGADATNPLAVESVFRLKGRDRSKPLSVSISALEEVDLVAQPSERTRAFMEAFLPGPVTVVCARNPELPDALTGGENRVGVRIPTHPMARRLLEHTPPLTATSANVSGEPSAHTVEALDPAIREGVTVVLDGGRCEGEPSTVVDVDREVIHRAGPLADDVRAWLDANA